MLEVCVLVYVCVVLAKSKDRHNTRNFLKQLSADNAPTASTENILNSGLSVTSIITASLVTVYQIHMHITVATLVSAC